MEYKTPEAEGQREKQGRIEVGHCSATPAEHMANVNAVTEHMLNLPPTERAAFARAVLDLAKVHDIRKRL